MSNSILHLLSDCELSNFKNEKSALITFLNPYSYLIARKNIKLFKEFDEIYIDGILLAKLLSIIFKIKVNRYSFDMTSLARIVLKNAEKNNLSIYFIGSKGHELESFIDSIKGVFPNLNIIGYRDGYFNSKDKMEIYKKIKSIDPSIVIVGMGTPLQERFLLELRKSGWQGQGFTCGGFFHQTANKGIKYYPDWVNQYNLRWMYRIFDEPKLFSRYIIYYPLFVILLYYDLISLKVNEK